MKPHYRLIGVCFCAVLLAACATNKAVYPAVTTSHGPTGSLTALHVNPFISREFVLVANQGSGNVSVYKVGHGGALTQVAGSPFVAGNGSGSVGVDQSGRFAYVSDQN